MILLALGTLHVGSSDRQDRAQRSTDGDRVGLKRYLAEGVVPAWLMRLDRVHLR
jgi:hypothetical protein